MGAKLLGQLRTVTGQLASWPVGRLASWPVGQAVAGGQGGPGGVGGEALGGGSYSCVGGGQGDADVLGASAAVELAGRDEDPPSASHDTVSQQGSPRVAQR